MYHVKFFNVSPEKRGKVPEIMKEMRKQDVKGVEPIGLFFPRGSGFMYASVTRYESYSAWEKYWRSPETTKLRQKGVEIITHDMDMFFEETELE